jgi:hypothetical protein
VRHPGGDHPRVVEVALRDERQRPADRDRQRVDLAGDLLQHVRGPLVDERVHRVQAQPVDVHVPQPHERVVHDVAAHPVGLGAGQVDRAAPGVRAALAEDRHELGQVVAAGPEVVVDDVLDHAEAALVAGVDEPLVGRRPAVGLLDGVPGDAVVAPVVRPVEPVDRQQLDEVDAEGHQVVQPAARGVERALGRERADVQLVDDAAGQRPAVPGGVAPGVGGRGEPAGEPVHAVGLPARPRVGAGGVTVVEQVPVVGLRAGLDLGPPPAVVVPAHVVHGAVDLQAHAAGQRRPDGELDGCGHGRPLGRRREREPPCPLRARRTVSRRPAAADRTGGGARRPRTRG